MSVLVVGSVALDSVETPFGKADEVLGGSANYFSASASHQTAVQLVGVVGNDYPIDQLQPLAQRGVDLSGLETADGATTDSRKLARKAMRMLERGEFRVSAAPAGQLTYRD